MTHPVSMCVIRDGWPPVTRFRMDADCATCGASVRLVVEEGETADATARLERELAARGCEHWRASFEDDGDPFDPRTEGAAVLDEPGLTGEVYGWIPVQGRGVVDGLPWYYRNRGGDERFAIACAPDADAARVNDEWRDTVVGWCWRADDEESVPRARAFIRACVAEWRAAGGPLSTANMVTP